MIKIFFIIESKGLTKYIFNKVFQLVVNHFDKVIFLFIDEKNFNEVTFIQRNIDTCHISLFLSCKKDLFKL